MQFASPHWIQRVTSTNSALIERIDSGQTVPVGYVLAADEQTAGRGRGDRQWLTRPGRDLACSIVLHAQVEARQVSCLSMAVALGVVSCLNEYGVTAQTKWPNDVIVGGRKIAGILPELATTDRKGRAVVVGIGLNVGLSSTEAQAIDQPATSLLIERGDAPSPRELLPRLLLRLSPVLQAWREGGFAALRREWEGHCAGLGESVTVVDGDDRRRGKLVGFGDDGQLRLDEGDDTVCDIWVGHLLLGPN